MRYILHESRKAIWSRRIALLSIALFAVTFGVHRLGELPTSLAMQISGLSIVGAVIAALIGFVALANIWNEGFTGAGKAVFGILLSVIVLAVPLWSMPNLLSLPRLYEVSTDTQSPPPFNKIAELRSGDGVNPSTFQRSTVELQTEAYPDIKPLSLNRPTEDAYSAVREAVRNLNWRIVAENPPADGNIGTIEATDRSLIFGFTDDVAIRVSGVGNGARVDVRASARHGDHDLGRNADRVRDLFSEVKTRLSEIEQNETMQRVIALREIRLKKALEKKERQRINARIDERLERERAAAVSRESQISSNGSAGSVESQSERVRSRSRASNVRARSKRQRRARRTRALRKFWEQLNQ